MSMPPDLSELLTGIGCRPGRTAIDREIQAGLTNCSYLVEIDGRSYVLRLDTEHAATLGLDRHLEVEIQRRAARAGLAPEILAANPAEGWLLYEYLEGRSLKPGDLRDRATLEAIADMLRAVHALPGCGRTLPVAEFAARYAAIVRPDPDLRPFVDRCVEMVAGSPLPAAPRCCHNDVVAANIVANDCFRLIDWEYACDNDPLFDLASLACYHDLDERAVDTLLSAYAGSDDAAVRERLAAQCRLFDALQWLWLAAQQVLAPRDAQLDRLRALKSRMAWCPVP